MFDRNERARSVLTTLVADFIRNESNSSPLITVTRLEASPDFHRVDIFVTVYPSGREEESLIFLKRKGSDLRDYIKKNGRLRAIPFFDFVIDYGDKNRLNIDEIAHEIDKEEKK